MKLVTLNVEGVAHIPRVMTFIIAERPEVICLQEAGTPYVDLLMAEGYQVTCVPRCIRLHNGEEFTDGLLFASLVPAEVVAHTFYSPRDGGVTREVFDQHTERFNNPGQILIGTILQHGKTYHIGTTHFTWTPNGDVPGVPQQTDMASFLEIVAELPSHIMCGDFNIPRLTNRLYADLLTLYRDEIPSNCATSLDATFHKLKDIPEQSHKLREYMVDYIFSQPGYSVSNVRQIFGVSDHAATVCEVV